MSNIQKIILAPVVCEIVVAATPEQAFVAFVEKINDWWPTGHSLVEGERKEMTIEPKPGGLWYETGENGSRVQWGTVLEIQAGARLLLDWQLTDNWEFDPNMHSDVEVTFVGEGKKTRVRLEHRNFEKMGEKAQEAYDGIAGENGWMKIIAGYENFAAK